MLVLGQRLMLAFFAILVFAACTDGYPKEDELIIHPQELDQPQRLEAMNQLGQDAHPEVTWIYSAMPGCIVKVMFDGSEMGRQIFNLPMGQSDVAISLNRAEQLYVVQVQPRDMGFLEKRSILMSKSWLDAIEMSNLVRSIQMACQTSAASESGKGTD